MDKIKFQLNDVESERAKEFMKKHNHNAELLKEGKMGFTALGMQFTYEITPGSFGPTVVIRCNYCKTEENITDFDNW